MGPSASWAWACVGLIAAVGLAYLGWPRPSHDSERADEIAMPAHRADRHEAQQRSRPPAQARESALERIMMSGLVQTEAAAPLAGARVCVLEASADGRSSPSCATSDAGGRFALEVRVAGAPTLLASHPGYLPLQQTLTEPSGLDSVTLTLRAGGARVTGSVVDASGGPIVGALLSTHGVDGELIGFGTSDGEGSFRMDVPSGPTRISARADGYSEQRRDIRAPLEGLKLVLVAGSSIVGRVIAEETLEPVADVVVTVSTEDGLFGPARIERSAVDGTFRVSGLAAGRYAIGAASDHWRSAERSVALGPAQVEQDVELVVRGATLLRGTVQVNGAPCEEGWVDLKGVVSVNTLLERDGTFSLGGLTQGRYQIDVGCQGAIAQTEPVEIEAGPSERLWNLDSGLQVTGIALTHAGAPLTGVQVDVNPVGDPEARAGAQCKTNEHGEFHCAGLVPGDYECTIGPGVPPRSAAVRVSASAEPPPHVVLRAHPEGVIRARVERAESFELSSLVLVARGKTEQVLAELEGDEFVFQPLELGSYEISIESAPPGSGRRVELARPGEVAEVLLSMPEPHVITGRVVDEGGQPIPDAWVRASSATPYARIRPPTPVLTDADGAFSVQGLVPGRYELSASGQQGEARLEDVASDSSNVLVRVRNYASVSGTVTDARGDPVSDFVVAFSRREDGMGSEVFGTGGSWLLPSLAPGTYELTARAAQGNARHVVQVPPGGDVSVSLQLASAL